MFFILFYNNKVYNKMSTKTKLIQERPGVQAVVVSEDEGGNVQTLWAIFSIHETWEGGDFLAELYHILQCNSHEIRKTINTIKMSQVSNRKSALKGTVCVISSYPQSKDDNVR